MIESPLIEDIAPFFDENELYKYLQIKRVEKIPQDILQRIEGYKKEAIGLLEPIAVIKEFTDFELVDGGIKIDDYVINSNILSKISQKAKSVYIFILTIGNKLESRVKEYFDSGSLFAAYVVDALGSVYVEAVAEFIMKKIEINISRDGFLLTARYSPGYCDINILNQRNLFNLLKTENTIVSLNESSQMSPEKSISGIFFKMPEDIAAEYKKYFLFCSECTTKECRYFKR
ncbi:MAG: vitamin B12 dependent-methionine synthase activation domain-containing protein [Myxococcota bacterium]